MQRVVEADGQGERTSTLQTREDADKLLEHHLALDEAIEGQLKTVVSDAEASAMALIQRVRALSDSAAALLSYLKDSGLSAQAMEGEITDSVSAITQISNFVQLLPEMLRKGAEVIQGAAIKEIQGLSKFTGVIKDISRQLKFLSLNASIVAATSGKAGAAFAVVAKEVRALSDRSAAAASLIEDGLSVAQRTMREGLNTSALDEQISGASAMLESVRKVDETYADIQQYYKTLFGVVTKHNTDLARQISEILGNVQYQDVVRQRIERIGAAVAQRNALLSALPLQLEDPKADLAELAFALLGVLEDYRANERSHTGAADGAAGALPKFELF